jgi:L-histidine Nalpha-methyltransferase
MGNERRFKRTIGIYPISAEEFMTLREKHTRRKNGRHTMNQRQEITDRLMQPRPSISSKYFYDAHGSELFEAITKLPEYYLTRTEKLLMQAHGPAIAKSIGAGVSLIELGAGSCIKGRELCRLIDPQQFVGVDISADFLHDAIASMRSEFVNLPIRAVAADMSQSFSLPDDIPRSKRLIFYPGSSIGNFDREHVAHLLRRIRALIDEDGGLLIGFDLPKDVDVLEAAYDDASGVTAAFNRNILVHVNQIIGSDFSVEHWQHRAFFNAAQSRIEMHLEATAPATVRWPGDERQFAAGERIHTENSYKYPLQEFIAMLLATGFSKTTAWTDANQWFAVVHARP